MRTQLAALATLAALFAPISAQNSLATVLAYSNAWVKDESRCADGELVTSVDIQSLGDSPCQAVPTVDCFTGVKLNSEFKCKLITFTDDACSKGELWHDLQYNRLTYTHDYLLQSFKVRCEE